MKFLMAFYRILRDAQYYCVRLFKFFLCVSEVLVFSGAPGSGVPRIEKQYDVLSLKGAESY